MTHKQTGDTKPAIEVRAGGVHLTIMRIPYGLITLVVGVIGVVSGSGWLGQ
ncbi:hypothetical protein [Streptomyces althioticus]|uniref:hypothetical protein n=1 Tax=Streptomyces althioticus TaxID=83380 RepID=UPI003EBB25DB